VGEGWGCATCGRLWWRMVAEKDGKAWRELAVAACRTEKVQRERCVGIGWGYE